MGKQNMNFNQKKSEMKIYEKKMGFDFRMRKHKYQNPNEKSNQSMNRKFNNCHWNKEQPLPNVSYLKSK